MDGSDYSFMNNHVNREDDNRLRTRKRNRSLVQVAVIVNSTEAKARLFLIFSERYI